MFFTSDWDVTVAILRPLLCDCSVSIIFSFSNSSPKRTELDLLWIVGWQIDLLCVYGTASSHGNLKQSDNFSLCVCVFFSSSGQVSLLFAPPPALTWPSAQNVAATQASSHWSQLSQDFTRKEMTKLFSLVPCLNFPPCFHSLPFFRL